MCALWRLRSACASLASDQSFLDLDVRQTIIDRILFTSSLINRILFTSVLNWALRVNMNLT